MARSYAAVGSATNTQSSSAPTITLIGSSSVRSKLFAFDISSEATPADNTVKYVIQRCTTAGTPGSSITPQALDPADPAASTTSGLAAFSVNPTLTASALLWGVVVYQRASYHWQAAPTKELVIPATSNNGFAFLPTVVNGSAYTSDWVLMFEE